MKKKINIKDDRLQPDAAAILLGFSACNNEMT